MEEKTESKTTIGVLKETQICFNLAKLDNGFQSSDGFIMYLLRLLNSIKEKEAKNTLKPMDYPLENRKVFKETSPQKYTKRW